MPTVSAPKQPKTFHFPEVRVVEASAGSGKTFALAKRYVQLLLNPALHHEQVPMRSILAITFTNKAAYEMKARILEFLKKIALKQLNPTEAQEILKPLNVTVDAASARAFTVMEALIHHYNFFQVQTIDSFINALLAGCAFKIRLSANFKIKRNFPEYLEYSLDQMIDRAASDKTTFKIFERFLHQYLYLENKTGWFPKKDMLALLTALYQQANMYGQEFIQYGGGEDLIVKKRRILTLIKKLFDEAPAGLDKRFYKVLESFLGRYTNAFDVDRVSDYFAREEIPVRKGTDLSAKDARRWTKIRGELKALCESEAYSLFDPYVEVFQTVMQDFSDKAAQDDILFLQELNKRARSLFDQDLVTVEELYYRLATRFHHYLIDEFQDTSRLQWQNLFLMVEEALSTGGSLFYVGDKKQAIYGFRGGEVRLFDTVKDSFAAFNVQPETLTRNFRSRKAIVDFNNTVFSLDNLNDFIARKVEYEIGKKKKDMVVFTEEDYREMAGTFQAAVQEPRPGLTGGYVQIEAVEDEKKDERNEEVRVRLLDLLTDATGRYPYRDIAVLTRDNRDVEQITSWLMEAGLPVESERTLNISENPLVQELLCFLTFLNSPIDNIAFTHFILGDIFQQAAGFKPEEMHTFLFNLRPEISQRRDLYIYKEFRRAYPEVWDRLIDEFFRNVGLYPLYELLISIVNRFEILTRFPEQQGFVMRLLEVVKQQEEETSDIASFLAGFEDLAEDLYVHVARHDAIKVLTIHKSKGLEFPVVIIPFLGMEIHVGSPGHFGQQSYILDRREEGLQLLRIKSKYLPYSESLSDVRRREYIKSLFSELNNVYVALTRAASELYAFIPKRVGNNFNLVNLLIPEENRQFGQKEQASKQEPGEVPVLLPSGEYHDWIAFLQEEFKKPDEILNRDTIRRGDILHYLLSWLGNGSQDDLTAQLEEALQQATLRFPDIDLAPYRKTVEKLIASETCRSVFFVEDSDVFQEIEVVNKLGHTKRVDRLIVRKDSADIIDYKSSRDEEAGYQDQVREYVQIVKGLYPKHKVQGFLLYLDTIKLERVDG